MYRLQRRLCARKAVFLPKYRVDSLLCRRWYASFALDGCGNVYLFDMRENPTNNEFPILFVQLGNLRFRDAVLVASTFIGACKGTTNPGDIA